MNPQDTAYSLFIVGSSILVIAAYFAPAIIAFKREHHFKWVVLLLNFIPVLWIPSFVWSIWPRNTTVFGADLIGGQSPSKVSKHNVVLSNSKYSIQDKVDLLFEMYSRGELSTEEYVERKKKLTDPDGK